MGVSMRRFLVLVFAGCTPTYPTTPLDQTDARAAMVEMTFAVQAAAIACTANARHLNEIDTDRSIELFDRCTKALIPARDVLAFALPHVDPWTPKSQAYAGCAGKAVRMGLEATRAAWVFAGYSGPPPPVVLDGIKLGARLEPYATAACDPLHPTTERTTFVDPRIPRVEPDYPELR